MKTYEGYIDDNQCCQVRVWETEDSPARPLSPRFDLRAHSPTGFSWGYGGSGPAQLALALAADELGKDEQAQDIYQEFKWKVIGRLEQGKGWTLTEDAIRPCPVRAGRSPST